MKNLIFLFLALFAASCTKSNLNIEVKSSVFQCCNIWADAVSPDDTTEEAVSDFLNENNISFTDLELVNNGLIAICATCCQCPAGKEVKFKVSEEDLEAVLELGFEQ